MLQQPAGQKPILEPLIPQESGVAPNYSKNIQNLPSSVEQQDGTNEVAQSAVLAQPTTTNTVVVSDNHTIYWIAGIALLLLMFFVLMWKQKWIEFVSVRKTNIPKALTLFFTAALLTVLSFSSAQALAQDSVKHPQQSIQRTIIEEGSKELQVYSTNPSSTENSGNRVLFSLGSVGLVILAGVAIGYYIVSQRQKP